MKLNKGQLDPKTLGIIVLIILVILFILKKYGVI